MMRGGKGEPLASLQAALLHFVWRDRQVGQVNWVWNKRGDDFSFGRWIVWYRTSDGCIVVLIKRFGRYIEWYWSSDNVIMMNSHQECRYVLHIDEGWIKHSSSSSFRRLIMIIDGH